MELSSSVPVEIRADFVWLASANSVTLCTTSLEETGTFRRITYTEKSVISYDGVSHDVPGADIF